jgi:hypothetical protein
MPDGFTSVAITYVACPTTITSISAAAAGIQLEAFTDPGCRSPQGLALASGPSAVAPDKCWQLETRVADFANSVGCLPTYVNITLPGEPGRCCCHGAAPTAGQDDELHSPMHASTRAASSCLPGLQAAGCLLASACLLPCCTHANLAQAAAAGTPACTEHCCE